jgi:hypothetical protein
MEMRMLQEDFCLRMLSLYSFYQEVTMVEGYDELMLASTFDHLNGDENVARGFLFKNAKLRKFWSDNFLKNHRS